MTARNAGNNDPPAIVAPTGLEFKIVCSSCYFIKRK